MAALAARFGLNLGPVGGLKLWQFNALVELAERQDAHVQ